MRNDYVSGLENYRKQVRSTFPQVDLARLEFQFEALKDWSLKGDLNDFCDWYESQQSACQMSVSDIPLADCRGWEFDDETGQITHSSGEFFVVQGVRITTSTSREVTSGWDQPILTQVGFDGGLLGLLRRRIDGVPHYLVEAKAEPGNPDKVQISPTLQATFSNLKQAHNGAKPRFAEYFESPGRNNAEILFDQWMSEDGGRLYLKRNKGMLVEVPEAHTINTPPSFYWASLFQLKQLIKINSWVNPHVRSIISHL